MDKEEFKRAALPNEGSVSFDDCGVKLVCRRINSEILMLQVRTKKDELILNVPYDDIEDLNSKDLLFTYNGCVRATMDVTKVVRQWGL